MKITDKMTDGAMGFDPLWLKGKTVKEVYEVEDSDRRESLLLFEDGDSVLLSCDPVRDDLQHRWEVVLYDTTNTAAGAEASR